MSVAAQAATLFIWQRRSADKNSTIAAIFEALILHIVYKNYHG
jgi:hypothetical protein